MNGLCVPTVGAQRQKAREVPRVIKIIVKVVVFGIILPVGIFLGGIKAYVAYLFHPVESFCDGVGESDTPQAIRDRAQAKGLFYQRWDTGSVWVLNKSLEDAPMFRIACEVRFKDEKVSGKSMVDAD